MLATLVQVTGKALIVGILRSSNLGIEVVRVVAWQLTKRAALHRESEKAKPNCVGAALLAAVQTRPQICREAIPPHIGHCRTLGLAGSQPEGGKFL